MAFLDDFGELAVHTVTWRPFIDDDEFGQPTYGAPQALMARVDFARRNFVNAQGQVAEARGQAEFSPILVTPTGNRTSSEVLVRSEYAITTGSVVNEVVQAIDVSVIDDELGVPHTTVLTFG